MFTLDLFFNLVEGDGQITRRSACDSPSPSTGSFVNHLRPAAIINTAYPIRTPTLRTSAPRLACGAPSRWAGSMLSTPSACPHGCSIGLEEEGAYDLPVSFMPPLKKGFSPSCRHLSAKTFAGVGCRWWVLSTLSAQPFAGSQTCIPCCDDVKKRLFACT